MQLVKQESKQVGKQKIAPKLKEHAQLRVQES